MQHATPDHPADHAAGIARVDGGPVSGEAVPAKGHRHGSPTAERGAMLRMIVQRLLQGGTETADALAPAFLLALTAAEAGGAVTELWRTARRCAASGLAAPAAAAASLAEAVLDRHDVLAALPLQGLLEGLHADSQHGEGRWTLPILAEVLRQQPHPGFFIKFLSGLGGSRPNLGGQRRLDILADHARALPQPASPALSNAAALVLFAAQDAEGAAEAGRAAPPDSVGAEAGADAERRLGVSTALRQAARSSGGRVAPRDEPPFIVVHKGGQDYVALCAASLAFQNGANNVVLLGDAATATIGIGRQAAIADYFEAAAAFAPSYLHHAVSEPAYGLFSFQRWLVVEEYCRKNRIDQCVVIDSDALAFSPASDIIAAMPPGFAMNDWTWTTTVRDARGLSALADHLRGLYAGTREDVLERVNRLGRTVTGQATRSFQDMHMFYSFRDRRPEVMFSQYLRPFHGGLDQASTLANEMEVGAPGQLAPLLLGRALKRPHLVDGRLCFRAAADGRLVRFHTVHCQGPAKALMHRYAALLLPGAETELAAWREMPPPPAAAPVAPRLPSPAPSAPRPLPNLRLPAHAALREQVRAAVAALTPLKVDVQLRLSQAAIPAGRDLPVELLLRNDGPRTLPARLLDHDALAIGFQLVAQTEAGPRRVGEPRLPAPPEGLPPGASVALRATLPTAVLPPGAYEITADLVYEYVRWFRKDETTRPRAAFRVLGAGEAQSPADPGG